MALIRCGSKTVFTLISHCKFHKVGHEKFSAQFYYSAKVNSALTLRAFKSISSKEQLIDDGAIWWEAILTETFFYIEFFPNLSSCVKSTNSRNEIDFLEQMIKYPIGLCQID